jgi:hypothetical protein
MSYSQDPEVKKALPVGWVLHIPPEEAKKSNKRSVAGKKKGKGKMVIQTESDELDSSVVDDDVPPPSPVKRTRSMSHIQPPVRSKRVKTSPKPVKSATSTAVPKSKQGGRVEEIRRTRSTGSPILEETSHTPSTGPHFLGPPSPVTKKNVLSLDTILASLDELPSDSSLFLHRLELIRSARTREEFDLKSLTSITKSRLEMFDKILAKHSDRSEGREMVALSSSSQLSFIQGSSRDEVPASKTSSFVDVDEEQSEDSGVDEEDDIGEAPMEGKGLLG